MAFGIKSVNLILAVTICNLIDAKVLMSNNKNQDIVKKNVLLTTFLEENGTEKSPERYAQLSTKYTASEIYFDHQKSLLH